MLFLEEKIQGKSHWHRYPTEIEDACHEVGEAAVVYLKPFARYHHVGMVGNRLKVSAAGGGDAKERLLCLVESSDVDVVDQVVGIETHRVVGDGKDEPWQEVDGKLPRLLPRIEQGESYNEI